MNLAIWLVLFAQTAGPVITGRITDAITHQPISGAYVELCCPRGDTVIAAADGTYRAPAGSGAAVVIAVWMPGYATFYDPVAGKRDFELSPSAHISGRLTDRDSGKPISGFTIIARGTVEEGRRGDMTPGHSGEDGSFRIGADLMPGSYVVQVLSPSRGRVVEGKSGPDVQGYGVTWFPGVPRREMAVSVTISPGETRFMDLRLEKRELLHVAGSIEVPEGHEKDTFSFVVTNGRGPRVADAADFKPGAFRIEGLDEGTYEVFATTGKGASLSQAIEVGNRSIDDLKLTLRNEITIRASVKMKENGAELPDGLVLLPFCKVASEFVTGPSSRLIVEGLPVGRYWLELVTPEGFAVMSESYGGRSVLNIPNDFEAPDSTVDFVITSRPASVSGVVRDANQKPVADAVVSLTPEPEPADPSPFAKRQLTTKSKANGTFRIGNLAPGKYRVSGVADAVELDYGQNAIVEVRSK